MFLNNEWLFYISELLFRLLLLPAFVKKQVLDGNRINR